MKRGVGILLLFIGTTGIAQVRMEKLTLRPKEVYVLVGSDILVADTLIMQDSSSLVLNIKKAENYIHTKVMKVGKGCKIIGNGEDGVKGESGINGLTPGGPCKNGSAGGPGSPGKSAGSGLDLYLYLGELTLAGKLGIELNGGHGGDGGPGGLGGGGSPGTRVCQGGDGGVGGNGANGGDGGHGGKLTVSCGRCPDLLTGLVVRNYGGSAGLGGKGGQGGSAGLVNSGSAADGKQGPRGKPGQSGAAGKRGNIIFEKK